MTYAPGKFGQAFVFDGGVVHPPNNQQTSVDLGPWFNRQTFTIGLWVNPASIQFGQYYDIIDNRHDTNINWVVQSDGSGIPNHYLWGQGDGFLVNFTLAANKWQYLTFTRDEGARVEKMYIDGVEVGSRPFTASTNITYDGNQFFRIGRWGGGGRYWNGMVDELSVFSRALTPAEIQVLVNSPIPPPNQAPTNSADQPSVSVDLGETATNTGTFADLDDPAEALLISASLGTAEFDPENPGHWTWTFATSEALANQTVTVTVNDGRGGLKSTSFTLNVASPEIVLDLNGDDVGVHSFPTWNGSGAVPITEADGATLTREGGVLDSLTVSLTVNHVGDVLSAGTADTNIAASFANGTLTLTGLDTVDHYQQVLRTIRYNNTNGSPAATSVTVNIVASDGVLESNTAVATINIANSTNSRRRPEAVLQPVEVRRQQRGRRRPTTTAIATDKSPYIPGSGSGHVCQHVELHQGHQRHHDRHFGPARPDHRWPTSSSASATTTRPARGTLRCRPPTDHRPRRCRRRRCRIAWKSSGPTAPSRSSGWKSSSRATTPWAATT